MKYEFKKRIKNWSIEQLENKVSEFGIDLEGYELGGSKKQPEYVKYTGRGDNEVKYSYRLNRYGDLMQCIEGELPGTSTYSVFLKDNICIHISEFDYPDYAYLFDGNVIWYVGQCGSDVKIKRIATDFEETIVSDIAGINCDLEEYLTNYLNFRDRFLNSTHERNFFTSTSVFS